ncbi:TPA: Lar family restriction alleviation protein [Enterobacter hormaechei]
MEWHHKRRGKVRGKSSQRSAAMSNLLPCPFCGGVAHVASEAEHPEYGSGGRFYFVRCGSCRAQSGSKYAGPGNDCPIFYSEVRSEWNQRTEGVTK